MADREAVFAARLARSVGRLDWWNIKAEHTPYQWACQWILFSLDPPGDQRNDLRSAYHTASAIAWNGQQKLTPEQFSTLLESLQKVAPVDKHDPDLLPLDHDVLRSITEGKT